MEKPKAGPIFMLFILLGIILPAAFFFAGRSGAAKEKNYIENGKIVSCTVIQVIKVGRTNNVTVTYTNENGEITEARATANKKVYVGDTFDGYVLSGFPNEVFCPADKVLKFIFYAIVGFVTLVGWILPFMYISSIKKYNLLLKNGKNADAELVEYARYDKNNLFAWFEFTSDTGKKHRVKLYIPANTAQPNEFYSIRYCELPNGKIQAEVTDFRLK